MDNKENRKINEQGDMVKQGISFLDLMLIFLSHKRKVFIATIVVCITATIVYFFILDLIYLSEASIKSSSKSGGLLSSLGEGIPDLGGLDEVGIGGTKSVRELSSYEEILISRRCLEPLIVKFNLMERDDYKYMYDALKDFRENKLLIKIEKLSGMMYVGIYDKDPALAKQMVEFLLEQLDKINIELNVNNAKNNREFIEKRYNKSKEDLANAEDSLKSYQLIYGIAPDLQVKAAAQTAFTIEAELKAEEVKLDVLRKILSSEQPEVKTQEAKVNSLKSKIVEMQTSTDINDLLRLGNSPQIVLGYLRLQRDVEIQSKILAFLLPVYEQAKIEEKRETPTILVLDKPVIAERKSKPKRLTMVLVLTFLGFVLSVGYFVGFEKIRDLRMKIKASKNGV